MIDDLTDKRLADLITDGYEPNVILETSPGKWQAVFTIPKLGTELDRAVGNELVARLNKEYGDPKVSGSATRRELIDIHYAHRAPGFENRKPKHERDDGTFPEVRLVRTRKGSCAKLETLAKEVWAEISVQQREAEEKADAARTSLPKELADKNAVKAYELQCRDVIRIQKRTATEVLPDFSRVDCMAAIRLRATGYTREATEEAIRSMSPKLREAHGIGGTHDWTDYARRTANYAYGMQGDGQLAKLTRYVEYWKEIDQRALSRRSTIQNAPTERTQRGQNDIER